MSRLKARIGAAWDLYRASIVPKSAGTMQIEDTRRAFYAGALVLFELIMGSLDPGSEPTERDMARMDALHNELVAFGKEFDALYLQRAGGSA